MSPLERRAVLALWGLCPTYLVYFALQIAAPGWFTGLIPRLSGLAAVTLTSAAINIVGLLAFGLRERGQGPFADERDRAIDTRATRSAYFVLLTGVVVVGMVMPFSHGGWAIVNAALLAIVLAELVRNVLIVLGYRGAPAFAR